MGYADGLLSTGRADRPSREAALVRVRVGRQVGDPRHHRRDPRCSSWPGSSRRAPAGRSARPRLGRRRPRHRRPGAARLDDPALPEPGVRRSPTGGSSRSRASLNKTSTDSSLEKINDAVLTQSVFGRIFGFGDLDILTAAETGIERVPDARATRSAFKKAMLDAKHEYERDVARTRTSRRRPPLRTDAAGRGRPPRRCGRRGDGRSTTTVVRRHAPAGRRPPR